MSTPATPAKETITARMARWASTLSYEDLSPDAVHQAKRFLLDSLGCALGGYLQHDVRIALDVLGPMAGKGPATVIGTGARIDPVSASLLNALMVRVMDYNDIYWKQDPSHPSDIIPAAMACAERTKRDGRELIVGIVLGHEFEQRFCEAAFPGIRERGWHHATLTAFVSPIVAGRMLGLDGPRIQHAIGISGSRHFTLGAAVSGKLTMIKNTVDPMATQSGVLGALLAEKGYTGPEHAIDGKEGMVHCLGPEWKLNILEDGLGASWRITECGMKAYPTEALTHTPISAVLALVRENDLAPDAIAKVHIRSLARAADILSDPSKYDPRTKETADHSLPYVIAAAIADRQVTPAQFTDAKIMDPDHPRAAPEGRGGRRPGDRGGLPEAAARHRDDPHHRRARAHQAGRFPEGGPAQPADRPRDRGEVRGAGRPRPVQGGAAEAQERRLEPRDSSARCRP